MPTKITVNLEKSTSQAQQQDLVNAASKQGFKSQERTIYIYEIRDFYGKSRAVFNELGNQLYLLTAHNEDKRTAYILEESKDNSDFSLNANVIGNALKYSIKMNRLLDTENKTYFITFNKLEKNTKMENIFYPVNIINKNTGNPEVDYEYNLESIGTILSENSRIKVYPFSEIGKVKDISKVVITPKEKWVCGGFDSNLNFALENVFPLWTKVTKVSSNTFDYVNMWSNKNWTYDWEELLEKSELDIFSGKRKTTITKLLTYRNKAFLPGINLIKKLLQINISIIRNFEGFNRTGTINTVGQVPGRFWQDRVNDKKESEIANIISNYVLAELKHWRNGLYQNEIKANYPWGELVAIPNSSASYSESLKEKTLAIIFMLSSQIISPYSLAGGRTDFTYFALPYFLNFNESQVRANTELGLYEIVNEELIIDSAYITFSYPFFSNEQIEEFNATREVKDYAVVTYNKKASAEERYGPVNPFLKVGDTIISRTNIEKRPTNNWSEKLLVDFGNVAIQKDPLGFDNNPVIICLTNHPQGEWENQNLGSYKVIPVLLLYSFDKWGTWDWNKEISNYKVTKLKVISWYDLLNTPQIIAGVLYNVGPQPKASDYQHLVNMDKSVASGESYAIKINELITFINDKISEVNNNSNKFFIGEPTVELKVRGYHYRLGIGPLTTFKFYLVSYVLKAVIGEGNRTVLQNVARKKGLSLQELYQQIKDSSYAKIKRLELENEGIKIKLIDQEMIIPSINETMQEEEFTTYPLAITGKDLTSTWLFLKNDNDIDSFISAITTDRQIEYSNLVNQTYHFINNETNRELDFFKIKGLFSSISSLQIHYDQNKHLTLDLVLGNKTNESQTTTTIIFKIRENEV